MYSLSLSVFAILVADNIVCEQVSLIKRLEIINIKS